MEAAAAARRFTRFRGVEGTRTAAGPASSTAPGAAAAIEVRGLSKRFGDRCALRDLSFDAAPGELLGLIGPNGAGKTTLLSILAGIRQPDAGEIHLPQGEVGFVPQNAGLYHLLTVEENLRLFARLEGVDDVEGTIEEMLRVTSLTDRRNDQIGDLSGGNQQRINIAIGLLSRPAVLLLDEPSTGLDPRQRARLWDFALDLAGGGTTVIFSTHNIGEAERYAERLLVIADGERMFEGSVAELKKAAGAGEDLESAFVRFLSERGH